MTRPPLLTLLALVAALAACGGDKASKRSDAGAVERPPRARHDNLPSGSPTAQSDANKDGAPDQSIYSMGDRGSRVEWDMNFDGRVDSWGYNDASGTLLEEELDLDHDGRVDAVVFYRPDGSVERKELALNFANRLTVFKFYSAGGDLLRVEQDEDGDGRIDRWDYYEDKRVVRTGWDEDGDGVADKFDSLL